MVPRIESLLVSFEAVPFAKVGGLADVAGALPQALASADVGCTLVLPRFGHIDPAAWGLDPIPIPEDWFVGIDYTHHPFRVWEGRLEGGARVLLLGDDHFFSREGIYGASDGRPFEDELERIVFFSKGVVEMAKCLDLRPDVVHLNDFQTALVAPYMRELYAHEPRFDRAASIYSIHNLAYQGVYPLDRITTVGFSPDHAAPMAPFELNGALNLAKVGIHDADMVTTVSPTYAREIMTPELGAGLDGVLRAHSGKVRGILNGIDVRAWDPATDPRLPAPYDVGDLAGKRRCKEALFARAGFDAGRIDLPTIGMVGRLVVQKGIDLLAAIAEDLFRTDVNLVLLGTGAPQYQDLFRNLAHRFSDRVGAHIGFDEDLAHLITAGADIFLMPSRYEPCGLNQMYAMRYGTPPVVHRTGGLADTVGEWDPERRAGTGFTFEPFEPQALSDALGRALTTYGDRDQWATLVRNGMTRDFGWEASARRYREVYEEAIRNRNRFRGVGADA